MDMPEDFQKQVFNYLQNNFTGRVYPTPKPRYTDNILPVYKDRIELCKRGESDRYYTEVRLYIKPPSFRFPKIGMFWAFSNGKNNVFSTVNIDDLKALQSWLTVQIQQVEAKFNELRPLEQAQETAKNAYNTVLAADPQQYQDNDFQEDE